MNGFEVFNSAGYKIAGSDYPNLVFYGKGTLVTQNFNINGPGFNFAMYQGSAGVPDDGSTLRFYRSLGGHRMVEQGKRIFSDIVGASFEYYSFGPVLPDAGKSGLEVFSDKGVLKFSTVKPFLKLLGVFVDPHPTIVGMDPPSAYQYQTEFVEGARKLAFQFSNAHYHYRLVRVLNRNSNNSYNSVAIACLSATGVFTCKFMSKYNWSHPWAKSRVWEIPNATAPQRMLVADVTGL